MVVLIQVKPLLNVARAEDEMKAKDDVIKKAKELLKKESDARKAMEEKNADLLKEKADLLAQMNSVSISLTYSRNWQRMFRNGHTDETDTKATTDRTTITLTRMVKNRSFWSRVDGVTGPRHTNETVNLTYSSPNDNHITMDG